MISIKSAALVATIFGAVVAAGCSKKDNYTADTAGASMQPAETARAASSSPTAKARDTAHKAVASKSAAKKKAVAAKKTATKKTATKKRATKKKATKTTY
jgi:hypothetical protein